jgi:hypothetical protein
MPDVDKAPVHQHVEHALEIGVLFSSEMLADIFFYLHD